MGAVPITKRFLPKGRAYGRPGYKMTPTSITIHNTANEKAGADAEAHAKYLEDGRAISWHYTVDHDSIVQHLPITEQAWHTGTHEGNTTSVGIEVCEYPQTDTGRALQAKATDNAAWLAAELMRSNKSIKKVVTHKSWSGKNCPRDILTNWSGFLAKVEAYRGHAVPVPVKLIYAGPRMPLLRKGSVGSAVRVLQAALNLSFPGTTLKVDGIFGKRTLAAVKAYQYKKSLVVDGIVGTKTWTALGYR